MATQYNMDSSSIHTRFLIYDTATLRVNIKDVYYKDDEVLSIKY